MVSSHDPTYTFPPLDQANEDGLLAMGGDLSSARLLSAYRQGIFPWFQPHHPILWWSPDPRCVLYPSQFIAQRSLAKRRRNGGFTVTFDSAFDEVIDACAAPRLCDEFADSWITTGMQSAYQTLFTMGYAHSVEVWLADQLVGGLYGISLGHAFFGESMFSRERDASKLALWALSEYLIAQQFAFIDCQVSSAHLSSLGAVDIPRTQFIAELDTALTYADHRGSWYGEAR